MDQKQAIADRLKEANNILVTVSNNPSVDQLASCIGLTLALNKMGKHATAVFSGNVPSTIEFLQPEKTLEKNTDSLRDFIIALDKSKADKLRYKVEDKVVKIFITPYRTSISQKDLDFSQGDFNVDVVLTLGVHQQTDLDQAITAHGRILHDAVVTTVNNKPGGELGSMNWLDQSASSLSELTVELVDAIDRQLLDGQMATAFLTGIVAETDRFSNAKTSPRAMSISAELMAAGANQQLVATKLEPPAPQPHAEVHDESHHDEHKGESPKGEDGTLEIAHESQQLPPPAPELEEEEKHDEQPPMPQIHIDEHGMIRNIEEQEPSMADKAPSGEGAQPPAPNPGVQSVPPEKGTTDPTQHMGSARHVLQPPTFDAGASDAMAAGEEAPSGSPQSFTQPGTPPGTLSPGPSPYLPPASAATSAPAASYVASMPPPPPQMPAAPSMAFSRPFIPEPVPPPNIGAQMPQPGAGAPLQGGPLPPPSSALANTQPFGLGSSADPRRVPAQGLAAPGPVPPAPNNQTLSQIEQGVQSPHAAATTGVSPAMPPAFSAGPPPPPRFTPESASGAQVNQQGPPVQAGPLSPPPNFTPPPPSFTPSSSTVISPTVPPAPPAGPEQAVPSVEDARKAVEAAIESQPMEPIQALNAQPLGEPLHAPPPTPPLQTVGMMPPPSNGPTVLPPATTTPPMPGGMTSFTPSVIRPASSQNVSPLPPSPPAGPPPMMP